MNVQLLSQYQSIKQEIKELDDRIKIIYSAAMFPKSSEITGMPRASGYSNDGMSRLLEQVEELTELYQAKKIKLNDLCLEIEKEIDSLESLERRIIRFRYLDGKMWTEISKITGQSVATLHRIHKIIFSK